MNLRVYRNLYWANQGLIHALRALEELSREPELPSTKLREIQAIIEETRASMNHALAGRFDQRLDLQPRKPTKDN
jgi:hypothetical protein